MAKNWAQPAFKELLTGLGFTKQSYKKQVMCPRRIQKRNDPLLSSSFYKRNSLADQGHCLRIKDTKDAVSPYFFLILLLTKGNDVMSSSLGAGSPHSSDRCSLSEEAGSSLPLHTVRDSDTQVGLRGGQYGCKVHALHLPQAVSPPGPCHGLTVTLSSYFSVSEYKPINYFKLLCRDSIEGAVINFMYKEFLLQVKMFKL